MKLLFFVGIPWMLDAGEHVLFPNIDNLVVESGAFWGRAWGVGASFGVWLDRSKRVDVAKFWMI